MSQHNAPALPPPPPTPRTASGHGDLFSQRRARPVPAQPPSITTSFLTAQGGPASTPPVSGGGGTGTPFPFSPSTPGAYNPRTPSALNPASLSAAPRSPNPAMEPYNPRQWSQTRQVSGTQMVFGRVSGAPVGNTRDATGMEELMPSPPPPYTPETSAAGSRPTSMVAHPMLDGAGFTASPLPADSARSSPQVPMSPSFPPPPGQSSKAHRDRSISGLSNPRALLAGLRGKQHATAEQLPPPSPTTHAPTLFVDVRPPASRRAASTGQLDASSTATGYGVTSSGRSSPSNSWQLGMPLPGPPPGPPPPTTRSQSLNRFPTTSSTYSQVSESSTHSVSSLRKRAAVMSDLGPIPPTPADWVEGQDFGLPSHAGQAGADVSWQPLRIDTGAHRDPSMGRRPATRDRSARGLRERRSLSRQARENTTELYSPASGYSNRSEQVFTPIDGTISQRREHMRSVSGYVSPPAVTASKSQTQAVASKQDLPNPSAPASVLTPPYTPAVRQVEQDVPASSSLSIPSDGKSIRPVSHLLHAPIEDAALPAPLSPARPPSSSSIPASGKLDVFGMQATERHRAFLEKEAEATSDQGRLELFASFMVHESRVRRDRYTAAYNAMGGEIVDLTRDMWRSYSRQSKRAATPSTSMSSYDPTVPSWASDGQPSSAQGLPSSASSFGDNTPATDVASVGDVGEAFDRAESRQWAETFKPTLSPIPSMAQSTVPDEESSRGRTPSRWWESNSGSGSVGKPDRMEKSHRETKYMGIKATELQESNEPSPTLSRHSATPGASTQTFSQNEYPPEKVGLHENADFDTPVATPAKTSERKSSTSSASSPLDVSRLITLPPPYPRHHPAVNNHHPSLTDLRSEHRTLANRSGVQQIKDAFLDSDYAIRQQQIELAKERRSKLRLNIQSKIADGTITFADAAQAENDFDMEEAERGKANARANFDRYETCVAQPLNTLLTDRITKADACVEQLKQDLETHNQVSDPNQAQEEGDEQPERLEKLTLLKWLFEAREQLHKEMFDLHAERSEQYSEVILTPYRIQRAQAKIDEATTFFNKDSRQRQTTFAKDSQKRFEDLQRIMERNVSRGVEDQLSAFWDIAPSLLEVTTKVPLDLSTCDIQVPVSEYAENPSYDQHPLQYLYSLLTHAEKSAYQFIESQTNLLCLLHEVRTATTKANLRLAEVERGIVLPEAVSPSLERDLARSRIEAEEKLTVDLKEKVGEVEGQWKEALGQGLEECKGRVRGFLEGTGGWEEGMEG